MTNTTTERCEECSLASLLAAWRGDYSHPPCADHAKD